MECPLPLLAADFSFSDTPQLEQDVFCEVQQTA